MTETYLSRRWIKKLLHQCAAAGEKILILNTQGKSALPRGVSDYLLCYRGRWISLEFKVADDGESKLSDYQQEFLSSTTLAGGIAWVVWLTDSDSNTQRSLLIDLIRRNFST